ncbi:MAG: hypothetical protein Q8Q06_01470 [bacterium]|nr:hypothetical protein [bacterium]
MEKPKILAKDNYLAMIQNSIGTEMFRNFYMAIDSQKIDILKNGLLSCAVFVSSILYLNKMISGLHATVDSTKKDIEKSGWKKVENPKVGDVLIWEAMKWPGNDTANKHIGFYISNDEAISNDSFGGSPKKHHLTYGIKDGKPVRKIEDIYRYEFSI